ncbi:MASE3 domain-containing protein [Niallia sp. XMNu-256]|uniref:MASE3 domain-containing protein n=1 Tax=Niallia sp. XMNu-256 TaxID=3082444 RepID=UPI0030CBDB36
MDRKRELQTAGILLIGLLFLLYIHYFKGSIEGLYNTNNHLSYHVLLELVAISIAFAIALQGWMYFTYTMSRYRLFIGALFFSIALIDILHVLSYNGMPYFIMENSVERPTYFWLVSRYLLAVGLFIILMQKDRAIERQYRSYVFLLSFLSVLVVAFLVYRWGDLLPVLVIEGSGVTPLKKGLEYLVSFIFFCLIIVLIGQYRKHKQASHLMLIIGVGFSLLGEILFTFYQSVHDIDNFLGHIYKLVGYYFLMKALYSSTIEEPYIKRNEMRAALINSERKLNTLIQTVPNGIIISDSKGIIQYANNAVETMLGYKKYVMLNKSIHETNGHVQQIDAQLFPYYVNYYQVMNPNHDDRFYLFTRRDGEKVYLSINSTNLVEDGKLKNTIYSLSDITDLMKAQDKINHLPILMS